MITVMNRYLFTLQYYETQEFLQQGTHTYQSTPKKGQYLWPLKIHQYFWPLKKKDKRQKREDKKQKIYMEKVKLLQKSSA